MKVKVNSESSESSDKVWVNNSFNLLTVTPPFLNRHENAHFELKWL